MTLSQQFETWLMAQSEETLDVATVTAKIMELDKEAVFDTIDCHLYILFSNKSTWSDYSNETMN